MAVVWHGGNRWEGSPEIRPAKKERAEWGPGIYGSTHYQRARQYAKGGKVTSLVEFMPQTFLEDAVISHQEASQFVRSCAPVSKRADLLGYVDRYQNLDAANLAQGVPATVLVNLWVNNDMSHGKRGMDLNEFLVAHGVDASCSRTTGIDGTPEFWTVIFNPKCIKRHEVVSASEVPLDLYWLKPPTEDPLATIQSVKNSAKKSDDQDALSGDGDNEPMSKKSRMR